MKKKSPLTNLSLSFWVLILFVVLGLSSLAFLVDQTAEKAAFRNQNQIIKTEVETMAGVLQTLYNRSQTGE
ncbi:MAG: hypothetical protein WCV41_04640, partial [Patescibacteria group bacterium]